MLSGVLTDVVYSIPGWGSWVGEGVSEKEKKRHHGRFMKKQEGVKQSDRKDAKLKNVIINEKRNKKVRSPVVQAGLLVCVAAEDE